MNLHSEARTTLKIREEIKASEVNMSLKGVFPQWSSLPVIIHADEMKATLTQYLELYNHPIVQRNLGHLTPVKALNKWYGKKPELFNKRVYDHMGLDNLPHF